MKTCILMLSIFLAVTACNDTNQSKNDTNQVSPIASSEQVANGNLPNSQVQQSNIQEVVLTGRSPNGGKNPDGSETFPNLRNEFPDAKLLLLVPKETISQIPPDSIEVADNLVKQGLLQATEKQIMGKDGTKSTFRGYSLTPSGKEALSADYENNPKMCFFSSGVCRIAFSIKS